MITNRDDDMLYKLYESLLSSFINTNNWEPVDGIIKLILMNNGCRMKDDAVGVTFEIGDKLYLYVIKRALGNKSNEYFDYINIYDSKYFIVFYDYLYEDLYSSNEKTNGIEEQLAKVMGHSNSFDAIANIVSMISNVYYGPTPSNLCRTAFNKNMLLAPYVIASFIIYNICGDLTEEDTFGCSISYKELYEMLSQNIKYLLIGIRVLP